ncbi:hypothetical protein Tsubulata_034910 [Turnera subulata]|uniref:Myb/SANT-like domain-containing protein n=1 Tax=Turnera subulata TaxID=218843 RepID=A0A9Q0G3B9_9ROSI|nr:hypothetical protein Tsubulata_034910 [Turnera subulata]
MVKGKRNSNKEKDNASRDTLLWTTDMDTVLLDVFIEEQHKGNRHDDTFTIQAYKNVLESLREQFGRHIQKSHIKNRLKTLKKYFGECKDLFHGVSGFAWNPITKLFDATPKDNSWARKWRHTLVHNYDKLYDLCGEDRATGDFSESAKEKVRRWQREASSSQLDLNDPFENATNENEYDWQHGMPSNLENLDHFSLEYSPSINSQGISSRSSKRKAPMVELLEKQYDRVNNGIEKLKIVMKKGNEIAEKSLAILEMAVLAITKRKRYTMSWRYWGCI